ncbi:hypothetical protein HNQ92_003829 [Rhabdobacter roseus]|uniref:Uncharacterized protein n=1 Tax=Rhabdobacter roseus TaxID=1655419 RepID=A0A840U1C7_9BACT|nr:hypothetical protein [Rhabdobacter roseus]
MGIPGVIFTNPGPAITQSVFLYKTQTLVYAQT